MPHIVFENIHSAQKAYKAITPFSERIEAGGNQTFFVQLSEKRSSLTVRLLPLSDPEKIPWVKTIMARVAKQIKDSDSSIIYGKNSLDEYLLWWRSL